MHKHQQSMNLKRSTSRLTVSDEFVVYNHCQLQIRVYEEEKRAQMKLQYVNSGKEERNKQPVIGQSQAPGDNGLFHDGQTLDDESLVEGAKIGHKACQKDLPCCSSHHAKSRGCRGRGSRGFRKSVHSPEEFRWKVSVFNLADTHRHQFRTHESTKELEIA
jgi:hypothetical protein